LMIAKGNNSWDFRPRVDLPIISRGRMNKVEGHQRGTKVARRGGWPNHVYAEADPGTASGRDSPNQGRRGGALAGGSGSSFRRAFTAPRWSGKLAFARGTAFKKKHFLEARVNSRDGNMGRGSTEMGLAGSWAGQRGGLARAWLFQAGGTDGHHLKYAPFTRTVQPGIRLRGIGARKGTQPRWGGGPGGPALQGNGGLPAEQALGPRWAEYEGANRPRQGPKIFHQRGQPAAGDGAGGIAWGAGNRLASWTPGAGGRGWAHRRCSEGWGTPRG